MVDHAALSSLRHHLPLLHASATPLTTPSLSAARQSAVSLSASEVLRELHRLPSDPSRVTVLTILASYVPLIELRREALLDKPLLSPPQPKRSKRRQDPPSQQRQQRQNQRHADAIAALVHAWRPLVADDPLSSRALRDLTQAYHVPDTPPPVEATPTSPVSSFRDELSSLCNSVTALHQRLDAAASLVSDGDVAGHDGLVEDVAATWASIRARRRDLAQLRARMSEFTEGADHPQRERLLVGELVQRLDDEVRRLHERRATLRESGFQIREVSPVPAEEESSSEDEWEDAVEVCVEQRPSEPEMNLPEVRDWAKIMRGEEGRDVNKLILERFERQAVSAGRGDKIREATGQSGEQTSRGRGRGRGRGSGRGKGRPTTAKERIGKKLGIKKRRKRNLLDDP